MSLARGLVCLSQFCGSSAITWGLSVKRSLLGNRSKREKARVLRL